MNIICFHNPDEVNGYLSNWYLADFVIDGVTYTSVEQYMMYIKANTFCDLKVANKIMSTSDVKVIKSLGRSVSNYNDAIWSDIRYKVVYDALLAKFSQNDDLRKLLLDTGDSLLVECALKDTIWGIGLSMNDPNRLDKSKWKGKNLLGKALMKVREKLR